MRPTRLALLTLIALLATACVSMLAAGPAEDAKKLADDYWGQRITKCSAGYFSTQRMRACSGCPEILESIVQLRDPKVATRTEQAKETDRLNEGIEMRAYSQVGLSTYRVYSRGHWEKWRTPVGFGGNIPPSVMMIYKAGQWQVLEPNLVSNADWKPVDCSKLPDGAAE
jgi:hypothetical protein